MKRKGFTLIELLVVVAIIGILATIVLGSLNKARAQSRDARRIADIKTIQQALEIYNLDHGTYPTTSWASSNGSGAWATLEAELGTTLPIDPLNTGSGSATNGQNFTYSYFAHSSPTYCSGSAYMLVFNMETKEGDGANDGVNVCAHTYTFNHIDPDPFVVGVDRHGRLITPDTSGTPK